MSTRARVARNSQAAETPERSRRERRAPSQWWQGTAEQPAGDAEGSAATPPTEVATQPAAPSEDRTPAAWATTPRRRAHSPQRTAKRGKPAAAADQPDAQERLLSLTQQVTDLHGELEGLRSEVTTLRGRVDAYDVTAERMRDHAVQQARLFEEVRKLKKAAGIDATPGDAAAGPSGDDAAPIANASLSDPPCDWCRCRMTTNTTDAASMWCGKRHSNCRALAIENETDRQGNTLFLTKGLAPVREVVPYDELQLVDVDLGWSSRRTGLEQQKNSGNLACGKDFDRVLLLVVKGSTLAQEHLAMAGRNPQPARS